MLLLESGWALAFVDFERGKVVRERLLHPAHLGEEHADVVV
jgi:hypothetical protein